MMTLSHRTSRRELLLSTAGVTAVAALGSGIAGPRAAAALAAARQDAGSSLSIAQDSSFAVLDPAGAGKVRSEAEIVRHLYNNLVRFDAEMNVVPDLADSWTVSEDGTTWTFVLKSGVKFHDGTDFTADA